MVIILFCSILTSVSNSHFNSNLNDEEMVTYHLIYEHDKNIIKLFERKANNRKTLTKHSTRQNHFAIAKLGY